MDLGQIVIYSLSGIVALALVVFGVLGGIAFNRAQKGAAKSFGLMFHRGNFLRLATVVLIVLAASFLAILGKIGENGVVAVLSGVAGYVLGGLERPGPDPKSEHQAQDSSE